MSGTRPLDACRVSLTPTSHVPPSSITPLLQTFQYQWAWQPSVCDIHHRRLEWAFFNKSLLLLGDSHVRNLHDDLAAAWNGAHYCCTVPACGRQAGKGGGGGGWGDGGGGMGVALQYADDAMQPVGCMTYRRQQAAAYS